MQVKIGLDFGTHLTKVCIEDRSDRRNPRYTFFRFKDLDGNEQIVIPSLVQVNSDGTLSYGYVDESKAMLVQDPSVSEPVKPHEPTYLTNKTFPPIQKPVRPAILDEVIKKEKRLFSLSDIKKAIADKDEYHIKKVRQQRAKEDYERQQMAYEEQCRIRKREEEEDRAMVDKVNSDRHNEYKQRMADYAIQLTDFQSKRIPLHYRYFKQTVFSSGMKWNYGEDAMMVSVWYLTYVFFLFDEAFGTENLIVSMGTSSGISSWRQNQNRATQIVLTVYDLIENVFQHDKMRFLSSTIDELRRLTKILPFSQQKKEDNSIFVFPEAVANLQPLAKLNAFGHGLNLLVDIGGGTVDVSLFAVDRNGLNIYDYQSHPFGLNAVETLGIKAHIEVVGNVAISFTRKLERYAYSIHVPQNEVKKIAYSRNVVFTGGGSARMELCRAYHGFSNIIRFSERYYSLVPSSNIERIDAIHVLSTSLGLAMSPRDDSMIPMHTYVELFKEVEKAYAFRGSKNGGEKYVHGLSDY